MSMPNDDAVVGNADPVAQGHVRNRSDWRWRAKTMRLGEQLVKLTLDAYYNAIRPEANHETWLLKTTLTFQFPN